MARRLPATNSSLTSDARIGVEVRAARFGFACRATVLITSLIVAGCLTAETVGVHRHPILGWFALIPIFVAIQRLSRNAAAACGAIWGTALMGYLSLAGTANAATGALGAPLLIALPAAYAWLGAHATRQRGFNPLILGLGWAGVELAMYPLGLRHGLLATMHSDNFLLMVAGQFGGYVVVAFLVAFVSAVVLSVVTDVVRLPATRSAPRLTSSIRPLAIATGHWFPIPSFLVSPSHPRAPPQFA